MRRYSCASASSSGAGGPSPHSLQAEEAVPGEDGGARPRQPEGGEPRGRGEEAPSAGGGAEERAGAGGGRGRNEAVHVRTCQSNLRTTTQRRKNHLKTLSVLSETLREFYFLLAKTSTCS